MNKCELIYKLVLASWPHNESGRGDSPKEGHGNSDKLAVWLYVLACSADFASFSFSVNGSYGL